MRALLIVAVLAAGCLGASESRDDWMVSGSFTREASQLDMEELGKLARAEGGESAFLESFPVQFVVTELMEQKCRALRAELTSRAYVASIGDCRPRGVSADPDAPTSSG